jgi:parallel beta-helix repeat protein
MYLDYEAYDTISGNKFTDTTGAVYGVYDDFDVGDVLSGNSVSGGYYGFYLYCNSGGQITVTGNTSTNNTEDGIYTYECYQDEGYPVTASSVISNNKSTNNDGYGFDDYFSPSATWSGNTATGNGDGGMYFEETPNIVVTGNTITSNDGDGVYFDSEYAYYAPKSFSRNTVSGNNGYGFDANYGVYLNGSNTIKGNSDGACYVVSGC